MRAQSTGFILGAVAAAAAIGGAAWWYSPAGAPYRYPRASLVELKSVVDHNPKDRLAWKEMGLRLARQGDGALAEPLLREALALNQTDPEVATALGEILLAGRQDEEAFQILKLAVGHSPDYPLARLALGRLYRRRGSYHHAAEQFEQVAPRGKEFPDAWYQLAVCYLQMQEVARARDAIQNALKEAPEEPSYLALDAAVHAAVGEIDPALTSLQKAAAVAPKDLRIQANYASLLLAHQRGEEDLKEAEAAIGRLQEARPNYPILPYLRGRLAVYRQKWPDAVQELEKARQITPEQDEVYYALSQAYRRTGAASKAESTLAYYRRRQELRRQADNLRISLSVTKDPAPVYARLADLQLQLGDRVGAIGSLRQALELKPEQPALKNRLTALQKGGPGPALP
jgi:tetratricopeptide (TPR) repeat protein